MTGKSDSLQIGGRDLGNILGLKFHHLGVATRRIARERRVWEAIGYSQEGEAFSDPIQQIAGIFLAGPGPRLELLEPLPGSLVLHGWIERGVKIYHHAFEVASVPNSLDELLSLGARVVVEPVSAAAFGGRRISFVTLPSMNMIELIEQDTTR